MSLGLSGSQSFQVPNTDPDVTSGGAVTRTYPPPELVRRVGWASFELTPGSFLRISALHAPSGATQSYRVFAEGQALDPAGTFGRIRLDLAWTDRDGIKVDTVHEIDLSSSLLQYGSTHLDGNAWRTVRLATSGLLVPGDLGDTAELNRWSKHVHVEALLSFVGGVRPIDVVVHEEPSALAFEADDDPGYYVSHLYAPTPEANGASLYHPVEALDQAVSDGDPRGGTHLLMDAHHAQFDRLGPMLINWDAYSEAGTRYGSYTGTLGANADNTTYTEAYHFTTSTSLVRFPDNASTTYNATSGPGWSIASAAYSRRLWENDPVSMATNGSIPVIVRARVGSSVAATNGVLRIQAAPYSYIDVDLTSLGTEPAWFTAYGHLRCGRGPGDPSVVQAFWRRTSGTGSIRLYNFRVYSAGDWVPAVL